MSTPPATPPTEPPSAVATQEDLRGMRRWVWVAGIWAVAASIVALIALLDNDEPEPERDTATSARIARVERQLSERVGSLEDQVEKAGSAQDLSKLERRLRRVEEDVSEARDASERASNTATELEGRIDELEQRVEDLEQEQGQQP